MSKFNSKFIKTWGLILIVAAFLSMSTGCTIKSGPKNLNETEKSTTLSYDKNAQAKLAAAFQKTAEEGNSFYFSGWSGTKVQKRMVALYLSGSLDKNKGCIMDARIFGQPFRYYRWDNDLYISQGDKWKRAGSTDTPMEPFTAFDKLLFLADKAERLPDGRVLDKECDVYQIRLNYKEAVKAATLMGLQLNNVPKESAPYMEQLEMKFSIWVGKTDDFIYQFKTETNMPIPNAGSIFQEVYFYFWDYNSTTVNIPEPEKIEPFLISEQ